jgi:hypothetical protein
VVIVSDEEEEEEDDEEPHEMLYHLSFRVLGTTTTSYAEGDDDKYDVLSYNFNKVLSTTLMKYLYNFWLKYSLVRDVRLIVLLVPVCRFDNNISLNWPTFYSGISPHREPIMTSFYVKFKARLVPS